MAAPMKRLEFDVATWAEARVFVQEHHRHHSPPAGMKLAIKALCRGEIVGVAIIGRPVSRVLQQRGYMEVTRTCTTAWGVNRELYRRCAQFGKMCTYTMDGESGRSLMAAGWVAVSYRRGRPSDWSSPSRKRAGVVPAGRTRWEPA